MKVEGFLKTSLDHIFEALKEIQGPQDEDALAPVYELLKQTLAENA